MDKKYNRNRPVTSLIKEYTERRKGKLSSARRELQRRFDYLDYNQQKKILLAHLMSSMSDRQWAYPRLLNYWDVSFIAPVLKVWEEYHEPRCSWAIVRYFPKEYVIDHFEELATIGRNYYHMCLRFGLDNDFQVDKKRLEPLDYLCIAHKNNIMPTYDEALYNLFAIAVKECFNYYQFYDYITDSRRNEIFDPNPFLMDNINRAKYYVKEMKFENALQVFEGWSKQVIDELNQNNVWKKLGTLLRLDYDFITDAHNVLKETIKNQIPKEFKNIANQEVLHNASSLNHDSDCFGPNTKYYESNQLSLAAVNNSALNDLIEKFNLKVDEYPF